MTLLHAALLLLTTLLATGCTLIQQPDDALVVELVPIDLIEGCNRLGTTRVTDDLAAASDEAEVDKRLRQRAKTNASRMGGDTIVAQGPALNGSQSFVVYSCANLRRTPPPAIGIEVEKAL